VGLWAREQYRQAVIGFAGSVGIVGVGRSLVIYLQTKKLTLLFQGSLLIR
jgi:hypothetical protein